MQEKIETLFIFISIHLSISRLDGRVWVGYGCYRWGQGKFMNLPCLAGKGILSVCIFLSPSRALETRAYWGAHEQCLYLQYLSIMLCTSVSPSSSAFLKSRHPLSFRPKLIFAKARL